MYKILFLDIDGTITPMCGQKTSLLVAESLRRLEACGVPVCLNTGRNVVQSLPIAGSLRLSSPFSALDGLYIYDPVSCEFLYKNPMSSELSAGIVGIAKACGLFIESANAFDYYRCVNGLPQFDYDGGFGHIINYTDDLNEMAEKCSDSASIIIAGDKTALDDAVLEINKISGGDVTIREFWDGYINISPKNTGKAFGMKFICDYYKMLLSEAVAIGDFANDIDMILAAGMGVAMGNATDDVKNVCDYTTETVENDGVAAAVRKFFV